MIGSSSLRLWAFAVLSSFLGGPTTLVAGWEHVGTIIVGSTSTPEWAKVDTTNRQILVKYSDTTLGIIANDNSTAQWVSSATVVTRAAMNLTSADSLDALHVHEGLLGIASADLIQFVHLHPGGFLAPAYRIENPCANSSSIFRVVTMHFNDERLAVGSRSMCWFNRPDKLTQFSLERQYDHEDGIQETLTFVDRYHDTLMVLMTQNRNGYSPELVAFQENPCRGGAKNICSFQHARGLGVRGGLVCVFCIFLWLMCFVGGTISSH